jgi:DNA-binding response OmpR family regulator
MNNYGASVKDLSNQHAAFSYDHARVRPIPRVFVVCDQKDTAPVWGYILREQGLRVILETSLERAIEHWSSEITDLIVLDLAVAHPSRMEFYKEFRTLSVIPVIMILPTYHETEILEAYAAGVDDVVIKPLSPPIFLAKILSWIRRSWVVPVDSLNLINAANHRLEPTHRSLTHPDGQEVRLTNLEFRLLHLLMSRPGHNFDAEEIIQSIWGGYGAGDQVLLKNVVYRLRKKIEEDPSHPTLLRTWPGGYSFQNK